jgi:hypothetical protein
MKASFSDGSVSGWQQAVQQGFEILIQLDMIARSRCVKLCDGMSRSSRSRTISTYHPKAVHI